MSFFLILMEINLHTLFVDKFDNGLGQFNHLKIILFQGSVGKLNNLIDEKK